MTEVTSNEYQTVTLERRMTHKYRAGWAYMDEFETIGDAVVLNSMVREIDDEQDSYVKVFEVDVKLFKGKRVAQKVIAQALKDTFSFNHCTHEYDCCGCYSRSATAVRLNKYAGYWVVRVSASRNY